MGVNRVDYGDETLIDISNDTVNADELAIGLIAHAADGEVITGLAPKTWTGTKADYETHKNDIPDGTLVNITDDSNIIHNDGVIYDDQERLIGSYMGKPIYRNRIWKNGGFSQGSETSFTHGIPNIEKVINYFGRFTNVNGTSNNVLWYNSGNASWGRYITAISPNSVSYLIGSNVSTNGLVLELFIEYTKVGD